MKDPLQIIVQTQARAYGHLLRGSESLLAQESICWTERLLLKIVRAVSARRLEQFLDVLPETTAENEGLERLKESMLEAAVEASLGGHDLSHWQQVENGWQATCRLCQATLWVGENGLKYSLLENSCSGWEGTED